MTDTTARRRLSPTVALASLLGVAYGAFAVWFFAGFLVHESVDPFVFRWSIKYVAVLAVIAGVLITPYALGRLAYRAGARTVAFSLAPTVLFLAVAWIAGAAWFYGTREHDFDPFLQYPPDQVLGEDAVRGEGPLRVLAIGGSTTGNQRLRPSNRYPRLLEERLQEAYPGAEVFNAGADWWTTQHSLINYVTHVRRWQPDVVVIKHAINDLYRSFSPEDLSTGPYDRRYAHFYGPAIAGARPRTFARYLSTQLRRATHPISLYWYGGESEWGLRRYDQVDYPLERYYSLDDFDFYLRSLVDLVRADGAEVVLLTQASIYKSEMTEEEQDILMFASRFCATQVGFGRFEIPSAISMGRAMAEFNRRTRSLASETSSTLVDVAAVMPKNLEYFQDDVHFHAVGAELVAEEVANAIETLSVRTREAR